MTVRDARSDDAPAIVSILDREIREGVAHFGDTAPTVQQVQDDIAQHFTHPYLVWDDGRVLGFAAARPWKPRAAYRWTAEVGIYLAPEVRGRRIGSQLLDALIPAAREAGLRTLVAGMTLPNPASQRLFESKGFLPAGRFHDIGFKHGDWHDVGYWTLRLPSSDLA